MKTTKRVYSNDNIDVYTAYEWMAEAGNEAELGGQLIEAAIHMYMSFAEHLTQEAKKKFIKDLSKEFIKISKQIEAKCIVK